MKRIMNSDIFIPARLGSSRLPCKHLQYIDGKPAIKHLIERLHECKEIRQIVVCTTNDKSDDLLVEFLEKEHIVYFRGSEKDILKRFLDAANKFDTDIIVDVEGDKIYTDPTYVDEIIFQMKKYDLDFMIGNDSEVEFNPANHFIHGFIPAGIRKRALENICRLKKSENTETGYREFFLIPGICHYKYIILNNIKFPEQVRLTLDYKEDLELAEKIFHELGTHFSIQDVLNLFHKRPELLKITEKIMEQWKTNYTQNRTDFSLKEV